MNGSLNNESAMWDARCMDLQNSLDRLREERDELRDTNKNLLLENQSLSKQVTIFEQMVGRLQIALSQGMEL